jgi:hypothetical protein
LKHARYDISWIDDACLCREVQNSLVYFGTVTGPIAKSSTSVGIAAWLTNARRYRLRASLSRGDLAAVIAKGRLADKGIMLVLYALTWFYHRHHMYHWPFPIAAYTLLTQNRKPSSIMQSDESLIILIYKN